MGKSRLAVLLLDTSSRAFRAAADPWVPWTNSSACFLLISRRQRSQPLQNTKVCEAKGHLMMTAVSLYRYFLEYTSMCRRAHDFSFLRTEAGRQLTSSAVTRFSNAA